MAKAPPPVTGTIPLGPFVLERPIGSGGMADVWLGEHRAQHQPVAVKVLTGERAREDAFIRALRNEIHNVARLHHPGIILLFDTGEVDAETERASGGRIIAGSPWFAMELASHGALSPKRLPLPWATSRMLLLSLLDALAHAHARGVVHRDLKPGNILLCAPGDPRPGLKLTDFGISQPLGDYIDGEAESGQLTGTPRYMAPEQFEMRWRDFGPWTDLYALGCIAFQLATGKPPFAGDSPRLAVAHCREAPVAPRPVYDDHPDGFGAWVLRLLEKDPARRYLCAADAAWALLRIEPSGLADEETVVAGWEQALRSVESLARVGDPEATAATTLAVSDSVEDSDEGATERATEGAARHVRSAGATHAPTMMDRRMAARAPGPAALTEAATRLRGAKPGARTVVRGRPQMASQASEEENSATIRLPSREVLGSAASLPHDAPVLDDAIYPAIPPEPTRASPRRRMPARAQSPAPGGSPHVGAAGAGWPAPGGDGLDDKTFGPDAPWTELIELRRGDEQATLSVRVAPKVTSRLADVSELAALWTAPPCPPTWRRPGPQAPVRHLLGAGLGLYGLRQIPLVGREGERDKVWSTLREVHDGKGARVVVMRGPAGIGKTRLAEWFVERAMEVGAATGMRAGHGPGGGPLDGLPGLVALHARTLGLARRHLKRRLLDVVRRQGVNDVDEALALAELLEPSGEARRQPRQSQEGESIGRPGDPKELERVRLDSVSERHAVALRYLRRVAAARPVVAWFDDVQWGLDAIAFARRVLDDEAGRAAPILIVLSASDEALGERPIEALAVEELLQSPRVVELRLPHLPEADHRALVGELLGLEMGCAGMVAARTAGNPLFAVQLVGDFVGRGVLELRPDGFALREGERAVLPDSLHDVWSERVARVLARTPPGSQTALELGSVLGSASDDGEWRALCEEVGVILAPVLVDELLSTRLLVPGEAGLRFAHAMVRESVLRAAAESGRLEEHHRAAARMLEKRYGDRRGIAERIGRHLVAAQDIHEALPYLLRASIDAARHSGYSMAHALLAERDALVDRLGLSEDDDLRMEGWVLKAELLIEEGRVDDATLWTGLVLRHRDDGKHARVCGQALRLEALVAHKRARWEEANRALYAARRLAEACGDKELITLCISSLADVAYSRGRLDDSAALYSHALQACQEREDEAGMATALWNLAYVSLWRGEDTFARDQLLRQQTLARRTGHRSMIANGRNALGDLERFLGNYDAAEGRYEDALRLLDTIGSGKRHTVRVNMAMNALGRGQLDRAQERALAVLPAVERTDPALTALCHGVLAAVEAHARRWSEFDDHFRILASSRPDKDLIDADGAWLFEVIGDHARAQGDDERAAVAYENAIEQWRVLGRQDRIDNVERALGKVGTVPRLRR